MTSTTVNNFGYLCTVLFGIIALLIHAQAAILCSRCDSRKDNYYGECEQYPPGPTPCPENSESMFCSIVREIDSKGIQLLFARDCATTHSEEGCIVRNITDGKEIRLINVCFRTCASSGCNSESLSPRGASNRLSPPYSLNYMIVFFLLLSACINNCYQAVAAQIN